MKNKNYGESKDVAFGVLSILLALASVFGFALGSLVLLAQNSATGLFALAEILPTLGAGALSGIAWLSAAAKSFGKVGMYKKLARIMKGTPRFRIAALSKTLKKDAKTLQSDLTRLLKTGYFAGAAVNTETKELVFDPNSELLPVPEEEKTDVETVYKPHRRMPVFPLFMGISTFLSFGFGTTLLLPVAGVLGIAAFLLTYRRFPAGVYYTEAIRVAPKAVPLIGQKTGNEELDALLPQINSYNAELIRLSYVLTIASIKEPLAEILRLLEQIINHVSEAPDKIKQLRQFMNYYLPTTVKLLQSYEEFSKQRDKGNNIRTSMTKIENTMQKIVLVYKREYDDLYGDRAMDISAEVSVLQNMIDDVAN